MAVDADRYDPHLWEWNPVRNEDGAEYPAVVQAAVALAVEQLAAWRGWDHLDDVEVLYEEMAQAVPALWEAGFFVSEPPAR